MATDTLMNTLLEIELDNDDLNSFSFDGCEWRKPYTCTIPSKPTGVASITVTRSNSESNCDQLSATSLTSTGKVLYGDTISVSASPATGYSISTNPSFKSGVDSSNKVIGDVTLNTGVATENTYSVYYKQGNAKNTTNLPSTQTRKYTKSVALSTNSMLKDSVNSYTVSYAQGNATSNTNLPTGTQTSKITYTPYGWTTSSTAYNSPAAGQTNPYANGATYGLNVASDLTLYPNFTTANTGVATSSNTMTKTSTTNGYTVTYDKGTATGGTTSVAAQTATDTLSYAHEGWATSANGAKLCNKGASTGALSSNITLYPYFSSSPTRTRGSIKLAKNNMTKEKTPNSNYVVTFNANGGSVSTTSLTANTIYTPNGWTTTSGSTTQSYGSEAIITPQSDIKLFPCFAQSIEAITLPSASRAGYTFKGWSTSSTATTGSTGSYTPTGKVTLYAVWTANTYNVTYAKGVSTGGTLPTPNPQSRTYPNAVTLHTNNMTKSNTTANSHIVAYNKGDATGGTAPSSQTSINTTTYTAKGWTTSSTAINAEGTAAAYYANGASFGKDNTTNLTLYPNFTTSTTNGGVTLSSTKLTKASTSSSSAVSDSGTTITVTYTNHLSATGTLPSKQTATGSVTTTTTTTTTSYTQNGWKGSNGKTYSMGAATGALTASDVNATNNTLTMTPTWSSSTSSSPSYSTSAAPEITISTNNMAKSNTTASGYSVTYYQGTATSGTLPSKQTATDTISYTANGWTTGSGNTNDCDYANGAKTKTSLTLYPNFTTNIASYGHVTLGTNSMSKSNTNDYSYTVTFDVNASYAYCATSSLTATKVRSYTADGWTTTSGSTTRSYKNGHYVQMSKALTLYPCFTQSTSGGSITLPTASRTDYDFKGWATSSTATSGATGTYTPTGNITLYAVWEYNPQCICGEYGYHYCPCYGEYIDAGSEPSGGGSSSGGGSTTEYCPYCGAELWNGSCTGCGCI